MQGWGLPLRPMFLRSALTSFFLVVFALSNATAAEKIRVIVFTGGHGFTKEPFFRIFRENPEIDFTAVAHGPDSADGWERADLTAADVVVLYDMPKTITPTQQDRFRSIIARGTGLV